jgi:phage terminase small subunit
MALTHKQRLFVEEYLRTWNATQAAIAAGYSEKTAYSIGSENLKKPEIAAEIQARIEEKTASADEVLVRLAEQLRLDLSPFVVYHEGTGDWTINLKSLIGAGLGRFIKGIKPTKFGSHIEFHDSFAALQLVARHHGLLKEQAAGTAEDPVHQVTMTLEEWRAERAARRAQIAETMAAFEDSVSERSEDGTSGVPG